MSLIYLIHNTYMKTSTVKEYEFDTPDDPNCWNRQKMKKENEKFLHKNSQLIKKNNIKNTFNAFK